MGGQTRQRTLTADIIMVFEELPIVAKHAIRKDTLARTAQKTAAKKKPAKKAAKKPKKEKKKKKKKKAKKKNAAKQKAKGIGLFKKCTCSADLAAITGLKSMTRGQAVKAVWVYIK